MTNEMIERLVAMGCNEWKKHGYHRLYVDIESIGLRISRYNTGNISYAEFDGEKISNCAARCVSWPSSSKLISPPASGNATQHTATTWLNYSTTRSSPSRKPRSCTPSRPTAFS